MNHNIIIPERVVFDTTLRPSVLKCYLRLHAVYEPSIWIQATRTEIKQAIKMNPNTGIYNLLHILACKDYINMRESSLPHRGGYPPVEFMLPPYPPTTTTK